MRKEGLSGALTKLADFYGRPGSPFYDPNKEKEYLQQALDEREPEASLLVARLLMDPQSPRYDLDKAEQWLLEMQEGWKNYDPGQPSYLLWQLYSDQSSPKHNPAKAAACLKEAADSHPSAMVELYRQRRGQGDLSNETLGLLFKASSQSNPDAAEELCRLLCQKKVPAILSQYRERILNLCLSMLPYQKIYACAKRGLEKGAYKLPRFILWELADRSYLPALTVLAEAYRRGRYGVEVDLEQPSDLQKEIDGVEAARKYREKNPIVHLYLW